MRVAPVVEHIRERTDTRPEALVVLGSGLGDVERRIGDATVIPFSDLPGLPRPSVTGHAGRFIMGRLGGSPVLVQSGRFHAYEGHPMALLALPVRVASDLGASILLATNAAGAIREDLEAGSLVLVDDHLNLMSANPLVGPVHPGEERFPDMSVPYDRELADAAENEAGRLGYDLRRGVYAAMLGPSYETAAEVRMLAGLGADVVGMSTVPEVTTARARGMRCMALSMVTNAAAGRGEGGVSHAEVLDVARATAGRLADIVTGVLARIAVARQSGEAK
ncbi:MAG: purine-nucleoside phosphorylase [Gemmatimonadota bacterium]|nr:purine-nucleoside phosphorylase [Gemmatimonadota bacterium]